MALGATNMWLPAVAVLLLSSLSLSAAQATRVFTLNVSYITSSPDCVQKTFYGINGGYPGPDLLARIGDRMLITVINSLNDTSLSMHWHGLFQAGTVWMDGPAYGTQCPIPPGGTFVYNFTVPRQHGTFWYHGHLGLLRSSVYGLLKILPTTKHVPPGLLQNVSTIEPKLLLNDWFWQPAPLLESRLGAAMTTGLLGQPSNVLINGRGRTNCSDPAIMQTCANRMGQNCSCNRFRMECLLGVTTLEPLRYYRFRVVNVGLHAHLNLQIQNHTMTVVEMDGNYVAPVTVTSLDIHPGMAFSVIVYLDQPVANYWIRVAHRSEYWGVGMAILRYVGALGLPLVDAAEDMPSLATTYGFEQQWMYKALVNATVNGRPLADVPVAKRLVLRWNRNRVKLANGTDLTGRYSINNISWVGSETPIAYADYYRLPGVFDFNIVEQADKPMGSGIGYAKQGTSIFDVPQNILLEMVFQNNNPPGLNHPWHLHGNDFWIVGRGEGDFNTSLPLEAQTNSTTLNLVNPQFRNIALVASNTWVAVRLFTSNPGVWNVHCHLEAHMKNGMQTFLRVGNVSYPGPPDGWNKHKCGLVV